MNENIQDRPAKVSARRRLIRGAFAAPAALTLYSGSAFAVTSNTCVARQVASPATVVDPATSANNGGADTYIRVQLRQKRPGPNQSTWVFGGDLLVAATLTTAQSSNSFLGSDNWYCYSASGSAGFLTGTVYSNSLATANPGGTPALLANSFVAIRVNSAGRIVGVTDAGLTSAVSHSCWSSFSRTLI